MAEPTWEDLFGRPDETPKQPATPAAAADQPPVADSSTDHLLDLFDEPVAPVATPARATPVQQHNNPEPAPTRALPVQQPSADPRARRSAPPSLSEAGTAPRSRRERSRYAGDGKPPKRRLTWLWVILIIVAFAGVGAVVVNAAFGPEVKHFLAGNQPIDYTGTGNGQPATVTIVSGQIGSDIAKSLTKAGVTRTTAAFYDLLLKQTKQPVFEPGTYKLE